MAWAIDGFNMDILFVLTRGAAEEFISTAQTTDGRAMDFPTCGGGNNLDTEHPLFRAALPPQLQRPLRVAWSTRLNQSIRRVYGGLLGSTRNIRAPSDINWARLKRGMEAHAADFRWACGARHREGRTIDDGFRVTNHPWGRTASGGLADEERLRYDERNPTSEGGLTLRAYDQMD